MSDCTATFTPEVARGTCSSTLKYKDQHKKNKRSGRFTL